MKRRGLLKEEYTGIGSEKIQKLNLGCGQKYLEGWVNVDISDKDMYGRKIKIDIKHNLNNFPYPFPDNYFDRVIMDNVLEHLEDPLSVIKELERVCKKGARIKIIVPHFAYYRAYKDPTHKHYFCMEAIQVLLIGSNLKLIDAEFDLGKNKIARIIGRILTRKKIIYERFVCYYFPVQGIIWELQK
jgi:ubiquinone/menaquinone biosynthesis C-methylase UbiE